MDYPAPTNIEQLRRFLGMVGWYARFIEHENDIIVSLTKLPKKDQPWIWGDEQQEAFESLRKALTEAPVLARPDFNRTFYSHFDGSSCAIGVCVVQISDDGEHPIFYASWMLNKHQRCYTVSEIEFLAVLFAVRNFRSYIEGYHLVFVTDHSALTWILKKRESFQDAWRGG